MDILITGGTGFIGRNLTERLLGLGYKVTILTRRPSYCSRLFSNRVTAISRFEDIKSDTQFDYIINLAGEPVADRRWSEHRISLLRDSRIGITKQLIAFVQKLKTKPKKLISGSAIGFYGDKGSTLVDEFTDPHPEFTHELCNDWEQAALGAENQNIPVCLLRTGLVIGPKGGFLKKLLLPFKLGLGGKLGPGDQWMSWIHIDDVVSIIIYLMQHPTLNGPFNATAPNPVTNKQFTASLGGILKRPTLLAVPSLVLKLGLGEMSRLLLTGQRVLPQRLYEAGYKFKYTDIDEALRSATHKQ